MKTIRIIPRLDIKGPNLVKGIHLEGLRVLGKPENFAKYYYENGADELLYMDVVASLFNRNSLHDIISKTAKNIFIPLTVGGGLRTIDDIKEVLRAGADKVSLNTAAINNPELVRNASMKFGASTIVISIEAIKQKDGKYLAFTDNGREYTGLEVIEWAIRAEELGAGEIMITSIDREGTGQGFDYELIKMIAENVSVPVIACGGAGTGEHITQAITQGKADAVALASILHYDYIKYNSAIDLINCREGNIEFIMSEKSFSRIKPANIQEIKCFLNDYGILCRFN